MENGHDRYPGWVNTVEYAEITFLCFPGNRSSTSVAKEVPLAPGPGVLTHHV